MQFKPGEVPAVVGNIVVVVGALIRCALLHFMFDLKAAQMYMKLGLIWELRLSKFELGHNAAEVIKKICYVKGERAVNHSAVTTWLKKFRSGFMNPDNQTMLGRPKTFDSNAVFQTIETNLSLFAAIFLC